MEQLKKYLESRFGIGQEDWDIFSSKFVKRSFKRKDLILEKGQVEGFLSFIEEGQVRLFIPMEENDLTFGFVFKDSFVSAYDSFLQQSASGYSVQALSATAIWSISYGDLQEVYQHTSIGNLIGRKASEELFLLKSKRELSLLNQTAEQRYLNLFHERPEVIKELPLKYIASYIGVTPQALSRIRKRIS